MTMTGPKNPRELLSCQTHTHRWKFFPGFHLCFTHAVREKRKQWSLAQAHAHAMHSRICCRFPWLRASSWLCFAWNAFFGCPPLFSTLSCFFFFRHARSLAEFPCDATISSFQRSRLSLSRSSGSGTFCENVLTLGVLSGIGWWWLHQLFLRISNCPERNEGRKKRKCRCSGEGQGKCKALFDSMGSFYGDGMFVVAGASLLKSTWGFPQDSLVKRLFFYAQASSTTLEVTKSLSLRACLDLNRMMIAITGFFYWAL